MNKFIFLTILYCFTATIVSANPNINARTAILVDFHSDEVLFEMDARSAILLADRAELLTVGFNARDPCLPADTGQVDNARVDRRLCNIVVVIRQTSRPHGTQGRLASITTASRAVVCISHRHVLPCSQTLNLCS